MSRKVLTLKLTNSKQSLQYITWSTRFRFCVGWSKLMLNLVSIDKEKLEQEKVKFSIYFLCTATLTYKLCSGKCSAVVSFHSKNNENMFGLFA